MARILEKGEAMIWFSSDSHLSHTNIIKYCNRPFYDTIEMNETIVANWNSVVRLQDTVYFLGDFGFGNPKRLMEIRNRLMGNIIFIRGSHDKSIERLFPMEDILEIKIDDIPVIMCHFPMRTWSKSHYGSWHLYGHHHRELPIWGKSLNVGTDLWHFYPVSWEQVKEAMAKLPENWDLIKEKNGT